MNSTDLLALVRSDPTADALAKSGNDEACAARLREIAPPEYGERLLTELSIFNIYPNPADAERVLQTFEAIAEANPFVRRLVKWLQPGAIGVNFGDVRVKSALIAPIESGGLGLDQELAAPLLAVGRIQPSITAAQVGEAMRDARVK